MQIKGKSKRELRKILRGYIRMAEALEDKYWTPAEKVAAAEDYIKKIDSLSSSLR